MSYDVVDLRDFYAQRLGTVARRFIGRGIRGRWADTRGQRVLGVGYATPYLGLFREEAERCLAFMPAVQGVVKWPSANPTLTALVDEYELPLADSSVDRVLLVHALEMSHDATTLLREVWRGVAGGGGPGGGGGGPPRAWGWRGGRPEGVCGGGSIRRRSGPAGPIRARKSRSCCARPGSRPPRGARRSTSRRCRAAGSCAPPLRGSAPARRSRRRSLGCTSWK